MDAQIWYAIYSTLFGGIHGAFSHLGEVSGIFFPFSLINKYKKRKKKGNRTQDVCVLWS